MKISNKVTKRFYWSELILKTRKYVKNDFRIIYHIQKDERTTIVRNFKFFGSAKTKEGKSFKSTLTENEYKDYQTYIYKLSFKNKILMNT